MNEDNRRNRIIAETQSLIAEVGSEAFSTRELARRAEVSEALIFHHFKTKLGLIRAAAKSGESIFAEVMKITADEEGSKPIENLTRIITAAEHRFRPGQSGGTFVAIFLMRETTLRGEVTALLKVANDKLAKWLECSAKAGNLRLRTEPDFAAQALFEGFIWLAITLPITEEGWQAEAPKAFAAFRDRWKATYIVSSVDRV